MEIISAGRDAIAIYIENSELEAIAPHEAITASLAAGILNGALGKELDARWSRAYIEFFSGRDGALLLAHMANGAPQYFSFNSSEELICAAQSCPSGVLSILTLLDGAYILTVFPENSRLAFPALFEYGVPLDRDESFSAYLSEHGSLISAPHALDIFRESFGA